jgi:hypothetical protein
LNLNHAHTPPELSSINQSLQDCFDAEMVDELHLKILVEQRAKLVDKLLKSMKTEQRKQFANLEVKINELLIEQVSALRDVAKDALSSVAKSSRAIKQYQQV